MSVKTNALLDSGSEVTLTNKDLASKLNLSWDSIKWNHYSSYYKLLKHIAWILKLKWNYISYKRHKEHKSLAFTNLNIQDIDCAENETLKHFQLECFENEFVDLVKGLPLKSVKLILLSPFVKDGFIRVRRRIGSAYIPLKLGSFYDAWVSPFYN